MLSFPMHCPSLRIYQIAEGDSPFETISIFRVAARSSAEAERGGGFGFSPRMSLLAMEVRRKQNPDPLNPKGSTTRPVPRVITDDNPYSGTRFFIIVVHSGEHRETTSTSGQC